MKTAHSPRVIGTIASHKELPVLFVEWAFAGKSRYYWSEIRIQKDGQLTATGQRIIERIRQNGLPNAPVHESDHWIASVVADEDADNVIIVTLNDDVAWSDEIMERIRNAFCGFPGDAQFKS